MSKAPFYPGETTQLICACGIFGEGTEDEMEGEGWVFDNAWKCPVC